MALEQKYAFNRVLRKEGLGTRRVRVREIPFPPEVMEHLVRRAQRERRRTPVIPFGVLSRRERDVIDCLFFGGLSERETARILGISRSSVRSYKKSALGKLREAMEEGQGSPPTPLRISRR
ncbi:MAG: hypothetical protein H5U36_09945 [Candidatus Caldatribacterium sp.]|nr:hypothetical protein [Candidatus Caldatribacterium sp.]